MQLALKTKKTMEKELQLLKQLAETTEKMRLYQKAFFKNKNTSDLNIAKDYERRCDKLLYELKELKNPQVKMFG